MFKLLNNIYNFTLISIVDVYRHAVFLIEPEEIMTPYIGTWYFLVNHQKFQMTPYVGTWYSKFTQMTI